MTDWRTIRKIETSRQAGRCSRISEQVPEYEALLRALLAEIRPDPGGKTGQMLKPAGLYLSVFARCGDRLINSIRGIIINCCKIARSKKWIDHVSRGGRPLCRR